MDTKIHPMEENKDESKDENIENTKEEITFVYDNRNEYISKRNKMFTEIKNMLVLSDEIISLIVYSGIYEYYKITNINDIIKKHLKNLTNGEQDEWVEMVCWNITKSIECACESLPIYIFKTFRKYDFEKFLYNIIYHNLIGLHTEGYLNFIEEKNVYISQMEDEVEILPNISDDEL
jgi:hypothetical protein